MDFLEVPRLPANCRDKLVEEEQTDGDLLTGSLNLFGLALLENQTGSAQQVLNPTSVDSYCSQISEMTFSEFVDLFNDNPFYSGICLFVDCPEPDFEKLKEDFEKEGCDLTQFQKTMFEMAKRTCGVCPSSDPSSDPLTQNDNKGGFSWWVWIIIGVSIFIFIFILILI